MESMDQAWGYLTKIPQLLNDYSTFSYPVLFVLLVGGGLILGIHVQRIRTSQPGLAATLVFLGGALLFLSLSGFFLKWVGAVSDSKQRQRFIADHSAPQGEHWLLVFDFSLPPALDVASREQYRGRMENLVAAMSEVLLEDLPPEFRQPRVIRIATAESPWRKGVGQDNFDEVIRELNAFEIMWGNVHEQGTQAKAFLGISPQLSRDLDTVIPLRDVALDEDARREHQFGDGYYRLLGLVMLGMTLDTYQQAQRATGEHKKRFILQAADQLTKARDLVNNRRDDAILSRNLYNRKVDDMMHAALVEAGLTP